MASLYSHVEGLILGEYAPGRARAIVINLDGHEARPPGLTVIHEERHQQLVVQTPFGLVQYYGIFLSQADSPLVPPVLVDQLFAASAITHEAWALFCEDYLGSLFGYPTANYTSEERMCLGLVEEITIRLPEVLRVVDFFIVRSLLDACMSVAFDTSDLNHGVGASLITRILSDRRSHPDWRLVQISTLSEASSLISEQLRMELEDLLPQVKGRAESQGVSVAQFVLGSFTRLERKDDFRFLDDLICPAVYRVFAGALGLDRDVRTPNHELNRLGIATRDSSPQHSFRVIQLETDTNLETALRSYDIDYLRSFNVPTVAVDDKTDQPSSDASAEFLRLLSSEGLDDLYWYCAMVLPAWRWLGFRRVVNAGALQPVIQVLTPVKVEVSTVADELASRFLGACLTQTMWGMEYFEYALQMARRTGDHGIFYPSMNLEMSRQSLNSLRTIGKQRLARVLRVQHYEYLLGHLDGERVLLEIPTVLRGILADLDPDLFAWFEEVVDKDWVRTPEDFWVGFTAWLAAKGALDDQAPGEVKADL